MAAWSSAVDFAAHSVMGHYYRGCAVRLRVRFRILFRVVRVMVTAKVTLRNSESVRLRVRGSRSGWGAALGCNAASVVVAMVVIEGLVALLAVGVL